MSQDWVDNLYHPDHIAHDDLVQMEDNFNTLMSGFSGTTAPTSPVAGQQWYDTVQLLTKRRDSAGSNWHGMMHGDVNQKIYVYRNSEMEGWAIDSGSATDVVLAFKGGSTYTVAGTSNKGTWTQPDHTLTTSQIPTHNHGAAGAHTHDWAMRVSDGSDPAIYADNLGYDATSSKNWRDVIKAVEDHTHNNVGSNGSHAHGTSYRPKAAVGTMQYLDLV
jgi:hypothetical protein